MRKPTRRLIICSTPRSGSYLLARQLIRAGIGVPHEYVNQINSDVIAARVSNGAPAPRPMDLTDYVSWVEKHRTTPNGVFAVKLHWLHLEQNPKLVQLWLTQPDAVCILLYRRRLLSQAVSFQTSQRTGIWDISGNVSTRPRRLPGLSNQRETDQVAHKLVMWNGLWRILFEANGIDAIDLAYEDVVADQAGAVARIARAMNVPCVPAPPEPRSRTPQQTDAVARNQYLSTWRYLDEYQRPLGYSNRLLFGAMVDIARRGASRLRPGKYFRACKS
ncbi:Stf0 family sulfotransferase [Mycolicibacterium palauense]|uniref:Stf0 family sulfotransferase n=1 Tax=Mycolicibacterium palauense TaxID=2034511 RepID=UPI003898ED0D